MASHIQTNPAAFIPQLPVHTVTHIDRTQRSVTLRGTDGTTLDVALSSWGNIPETQPVVGKKVQFREDNPRLRQL